MAAYGGEPDERRPVRVTESLLHVVVEDGQGGETWYEFYADRAVRAVEVRGGRLAFTREPLALPEKGLSRLERETVFVDPAEFERRWVAAWDYGVERASPWQRGGEVVPADSVHRRWPRKHTALLIASGVPVTERRPPRRSTPAHYMDELLREAWHVLYLPFQNVHTPVPTPHRRNAQAELARTDRWATVVEMSRYPRPKLAFLGRERSLFQEDLLVFVGAATDVEVDARRLFPQASLIDREHLAPLLARLREERLPPHP